ncbi:MAG: bifunctional precorrin-2 dehydrogenase/sirohydrochlorin ferrochelatase, partial [Peptococcaceae bacterium]|nr:bifunctional precorrin-2 dehydrogenase/sirohydrochlorin ferrochelatase [Peptococcaceae bacterium]
MPYYPVMLDLKGLPCLVVGGGQVAERKVLALIECQAVVTVISPEISPILRDLWERDVICWLERSFCAGDVGLYHLVVSAVNRPEINSVVAEECRQAKIPVNVVDDPPNCTFLLPAVLRRGELVIAVSTGGASPLVARHIRDELAQKYSSAYGEYLTLLAEARDRVKQACVDPRRRREIFTELTNGDLLNLVQAGRLDNAKEWVKR